MADLSSGCLTWLRSWLPLPCLVWAPRRLRPLKRLILPSPLFLSRVYEIWIDLSRLLVGVRWSPLSIPLAFSFDMLILGDLLLLYVGVKSWAATVGESGGLAADESLPPLLKGELLSTLKLGLLLALFSLLPLILIGLVKSLGEVLFLRPPGSRKS